MHYTVYDLLKNLIPQNSWCLICHRSPPFLGNFQLTFIHTVRFLEKQVQLVLNLSQLTPLFWDLSAHIWRQIHNLNGLHFTWKWTQCKISWKKTTFIFFPLLFILDDEKLFYSSSSLKPFFMGVLNHKLSIMVLCIGCGVSSYGTQN